VRLTVELPLVPIFSVFGLNERTATIWPLLCSLGSVLLTYLVGRRLGGPPVGFLAGTIVAVYPLEVLYATQLLPDAMLPCFVLLSVLLYLRADDLCVQPARSSALTPPTPLTPSRVCGNSLAGAFLLAGAALGLAYYARLNAPVVLLFLLPYSLLRRRLGLAHLWLLPGFLAVVLAGELLFLAHSGVPLWGIRRQAAIAGSNPEFTRAAGWAHFTVFARMLWTHPLFATWTRLLLASLPVLVWLRPRRWWVGPLWLAATYAYLEVLSQWPAVSLPEKGDRMLSILSAPLAVTIAMAASVLLERVRGATPRAALAFGIAGLAVPYVVQPGLRQLPRERLAYDQWRGTFLHQMAAAVASLPRGPVYFVNDWRTWVNLYAGYAPDVLRAGGPARALRVADGTTMPLERVRQDATLMVLDARDAYVLHDVGVMLRRPIGWTPVAQVGPTTSIFYAPPDVDERRWVVHLEPELFDGVTPDQDGALETLTGWGSYSQPSYSRGKAAIARVVGARMTRSIPPLPAGDLRLAVRVYSYGAGTNRVAIGLNGAERVATWGGGAAGQLTVDVPIRTERAGGELFLEVREKGQAYAIVDAIDVTPDSS
jgi:hypothetical protein